MWGSAAEFASFAYLKSGSTGGDPQVEVGCEGLEDEDDEAAPEEARGAKQTKLEKLRLQLQKVKLPSVDYLNGFGDKQDKDNTQQDSPPSRKRWSILGVFMDDSTKQGNFDGKESSGENVQQPSPPRHRRRWSLLPKLADAIKIDNHAPNDADSDEEDKDARPDDQGQGSPTKSNVVVDTRSVSDIQGEAQRVCSVLSGDAKRHMKILKSIDPTNVVLNDVKKAIAEANVWLTECIAPTQSGEAECVKEAKITQQYHAERCLLDANALAVNEIDRLSQLAISNAKSKDIPALPRTQSF